MGLRVEEQLTVSQDKTYKFSNVLIRKNHLKGMEAIVSFDVLGSDGRSHAKVHLSYSGSEFNSFWEGFDSGTFLYSELIRKKSINAPLEESIELEFANR